MICTGKVTGELFVEFGLQIKKQSPFPYSYIVGYANDYMGYIATEEAFGEGGLRSKDRSCQQNGSPGGRNYPERGAKSVERDLSW